MTRVGLCGFTIAIADYPLHFPVVEVQQTFYQPPAQRLLERWVAQTPRGFEFTLKAWQLVTHPATSPTYRRTRRELSPAERAGSGFFQDSPIVREGLERSLACAAVLRATALLFQCPASFRPTPENVERLRRVFGAIARPAPLRMLWEPRGREWVAERALARELCSELGLVHVVDPFVTPPLAGPVYWRLHGITGARHVYSDPELARLERMLAEQTAGRAEDAYVMFNNIPRAGDAKRFLRRLAGG
jgi:uncharacterized protein YecE (DUF72 family)